MKKIHSSEARTYFYRLLREVEQGASYTILRRGKPVASLIPMTEDNYYKNLLSDFQEIRSRIAARSSMKKLIEEGRRY